MDAKNIIKICQIRDPGVREKSIKKAINYARDPKVAKGPNRDPKVAKAGMVMFFGVSGGNQSP